MSLMMRPHPEALPHGAIIEVLPGIHLVKGTVALHDPLPITFSRNMTILQEGDRLVLLNSVRLDEAGLAALDAMGRVTDVIRLAANHGMDDPFYRERYGAKVWAVAGQRYTAGFKWRAPNVYFEPDGEMTPETKLPIGGAHLLVIGSTPPEGLLLLNRDETTIAAGDCLQNMAAPDPYFNGLACSTMTTMGFLVPHNVGPGWLVQNKPPKEDLRKILDLSFANVIPCHGKPVLGDAKERYRAAIERVIS